MLLLPRGAAGEMSKGGEHSIQGPSAPLDSQSAHHQVLLQLYESYQKDMGDLAPLPVINAPAPPSHGAKIQDPLMLSERTFPSFQSPKESTRESIYHNVSIVENSLGENSVFSTAKSFQTPASQSSNSEILDLANLYNSPSVAAARKEAGLPKYVPPDDTSWVNNLPRPPHHKK
jgi:hypothetical protein